MTQKNDQEILDLKGLRERLLEKYPFEYISRTDIGKVIGGIYTPKTMMNLDSINGKRTIKGTVKFGGKVCYPIDGLIEFLKSEVKKI